MTPSSQGLSPAVPSPAPPRSLWRNGAFLTLWGGQSVSVFGTQVTTFALPWLVLDLTHEAFAIGLLNAISFLPALLFSLPAGVIADRWNRRTIMLVCDAARGLVILTIPVAAITGTLTLVQVFIVGAMMRLFTVFFDVGYVASLPNLVEGPQLPEANGKIEVTRSIAEFSGQPLGGLLVAAVTAAGTLLLDAFSYVFSFASLFFIHTPFSAPAVRKEDGTFWGRMTEGLRYVFAQPLLRALALAPAIGNLAASAFGAVIVFRGRDELGLSSFETALLVSSAAVGQAVAAAFIGRVVKRVPAGRLILLAAAAQPPLYLGFALTGSLIAMIALHAAIGVCVVFLNVPMISLRQAIIPDFLRGRALSAIRLLVLSMYPLGAITGGVLGSVLGAWATFVFAALVIAGAVLFVARSAIPAAVLPA